MLVFTVLICISILSPIAVSDGGFFIPTVDDWIASNQESQMGLIKYEDGIEDLTIVIDMTNSSLNADQALWIFPIPSNPEDANIDIINDIPFYRGDDYIGNEASDAFTNSVLLMSLSQPYASGIFLTFLYSFGTIRAASESDQYMIHEHVEKMGFTSELISAISIDGINQYLEPKNINLSEETMNIVNEYIGKEYSFVVSWISDLETFKQEARINYEDYWYYYSDEEIYILGVKLTFPTNNLYYPMKLTSIYDDEIIPILIQIENCVTPLNKYNNMYVDYLRDGNKEYTEIQIRTQSNEFIEDLWIKNQPPSHIRNSKIILDNLIIISVLIFIMCSVFSCILSSFIVYFKNKPIIWKFVLLSLANFLSIFFVFSLCNLLDIDKHFFKKPIEKKRNVSKNFILGFRITFLIFGTIGIILALLIIMVPYSVIFLAILALVVGILMFIYGGIKNPRMTLFIALFSIFFFVFLIISNIVIQNII